MYMGRDGRRYNSKYDAIGYEPTMHELERDKRIQFNRDLIRNRQDAQGRSLDNQMKREHLEEAQRNNFYQGAQQFANIHGRNIAFGQPMAGNRQPGQKAAGKQPPTQSFGPESITRTNINNDLASSAGELKRLLQTYQQTGQGSDELMSFINQHPMIGIKNATGLNIDDNGQVTLMDESGQPVKSFNIKALSNLNNYATQTDYQYDAGNKVNDMGKLMEQLQPMAESMAVDYAKSLPEENKAAQIEAAKSRFMQHLMKQYGPRAAGYQATGTRQPYASQGFGLFTNPQQGEQSASWQDKFLQLLACKGGNNKQPPPPPPQGKQPAAASAGTPVPKNPYYPNQKFGR